MCEHGGGGMPSVVVLPTSALLGKGQDFAAQQESCVQFSFDRVHFHFGAFGKSRIRSAKIVKRGHPQIKQRPVTCQSPILLCSEEQSGRLWCWPHGKLFERPQLLVSWRNSDLFGCLELGVALVLNI